MLISAGDKVVSPAVVKGMVETYATTGFDLCLLACPLAHNPEGGRVITRAGNVLAIVECPDIKVRQLAERLRSLDPTDAPGTVGLLKEEIERYLPMRKLTKCAPTLAALTDGEDGQRISWEDVLLAIEPIPAGFDLESCWIPLEDAAASDLVNLSLYIGAFEPLLDAVRGLGNDNAQAECYFTDAIELLASRGHSIGLLQVADPTEVMAFNTIEQLEEVRKTHALHAQRATQYPTLARWERCFEKRDPEGLAAQAAAGLRERIGPEQTAIVVRSPGRINIMGRHIDHQGGACNLMAINREVVLAASARDDDQINLWNLESGEYPTRSFTFSELTADIVWEDWLRTLDLQYVKRHSLASSGDWVNYVKGPALRLQHQFKDRRLRGMDAFVCGNIPTGSGLSSSSALVVAATEALIELNGLNVRTKELVDLCGEGEWFVGTRGGSADHAAIKLGRENEVVSVSFFPFQIVARHPFPEGCSLMVCHSGASAKKTEDAQPRFNARIACYHMAREVVRREFPTFAPLIEHLRDINTERLDITLPALYRLLKHVPLQVGSSDVEVFAAEHESVAKCVTGLALDALEFPLRDTALFGLAECARSMRAGSLLDRGDAKAFGELMSVSHNGDRVARWRNGVAHAYASGPTNECIDDLVARAESLAPLGACAAALWQQPGAYDCSTADIDSMVDAATQHPGVLGAQLSGAGLGGCVMILVRSDAAEDVRELLETSYYLPREIPPQLFVCQPSRGSQVLTSVETAG